MDFRYSDIVADEKGERERGSASKRTQTGRKWKTVTSQAVSISVERLFERCPGFIKSMRLQGEQRTGNAYVSTF